MEKFLKSAACILLAVFCLTVPAAAEKTNISGLYRYTLDNGLELYVAENHAAPLVYIEITVRAGGIAQTPETAGIFHLYEHMMFEGDSQYPEGAAMERAVKDMGVTGQNATTGANAVNYFFTIPSDLLYKGLEFWSYAIREPSLLESELETEKKVVISEVEGDMTDSSRIYSYNLIRTMFPKFPWRLDPGGYPELVQKATTEDLRKMLKKYYIPNNAALFVGGDVEHNDVYDKVKQIYGSWKRGENPWKEPLEPQTAEPFEKTEYRVMANDKISPESASVRVIYRGPDSDAEPASVYPATVFDELLDDPDGMYKTMMLSIKDLQIPNANYVSEGYSPMRGSGLISFSASFFSPDQNLPGRAKLFADSIAQKFIPQVLSDKTAFTADQFKQVKQTLKDYSITSTETAEGLLGEVQYWWVNVAPDFYFSYHDNLKKVGKTDIDTYLRRYIEDKHPLVTVLVNPSVYEAQKQAFKDAGFIEFTKDTAYWWKSGAAGMEASK